MSIDEIRSEIAMASKKCDRSPGVIYLVNIKDGSNFSIHKTMLPLCEDNKIKNPIEKDKIVVKKAKREDEWTFNFDKGICQCKNTITKRCYI